MTEKEKTFLKFRKGKQKELLEQAITKAGSERKLAKLVGIPKGYIYNLKFEKRNLSNFYAKNLFKFLGIPRSKIEKDILEILPANWGKIKGGVKLIKIKKEKGIFEKDIEKLRKLSSIRMKKWHKKMKKEEPRTYYIWQYERFKKIGGGYKIKTEKGIFVRNKFEKSVADFLYSLKLNFQYEPYLNVKGKAYFPDFVVGEHIIEATEWKHPSKMKLAGLKKKLEDYEELGYRTCLFIPSKYRNFYKDLEGSVISDWSELQSFLCLRSLDARSKAPAEQ